MQKRADIEKLLKPAAAFLTKWGEKLTKVIEQRASK